MYGGILDSLQAYGCRPICKSVCHRYIADGVLCEGKIHKDPKDFCLLCGHPSLSLIPVWGLG